MVSALAVSSRTGRFAYSLRQACREMHDSGVIVSDSVLIPLLRRAMEARNSVAVLYGPTGCGKTYLCEKIAEATQRKLVRIDASQLVATGYYGITVGKIVAQIAEAQRQGLVMLLLDEICKLSTDTSHGSWLDQVSGQVLTLLQGGFINGDRDGDSNKPVTADLNSVFIVLAGSFSRIGGRHADVETPGYAGFTFGRCGKSASHPASADDDDFTWLSRAGGFFTPEIIGRISHVAGLPALDETALFDIACNQREEFIRRAIRHYGPEIVDVHPAPEPAVLAREAQDRCLGARWIRTALEKWLDVLADLIVNAPDDAFPGEPEPASPAGKANPFRPHDGHALQKQRLDGTAKPDNAEGVRQGGQSLQEYQESERMRIAKEKEAEAIARQEAAMAADADDDPFGQVDADYESWLQDQAERAEKDDAADEQELLAGENP